MKMLKLPHGKKFGGIMADLRRSGLTHGEPKGEGRTPQHHYRCEAFDEPRRDTGRQVGKFKRAS
jgi:hypothetical protein